MTQNWHDTPFYFLPMEQEQLDAEWMTAAQAAKKWRVSLRTARRYFAKMDTQLVLIAEVGKRGRMLQMVATNANAPRGQRGNPNFRDSDYQRELATRLRFKRGPYKRRRKNA